jgi:hypothetical protein
MPRQNKKSQMWPAISSITLLLSQAQVSPYEHSTSRQLNIERCCAGSGVTGKKERRIKQPIHIVNSLSAGAVPTAGFRGAKNNGPPVEERACLRQASRLARRRGRCSRHRDVVYDRQIRIGLCIGSSNVASSYGAAGAFLIILLWVYYPAQIFLLGAEFTRASAGGMAATPPSVKPTTDQMPLEPTTDAHVSAARMPPEQAAYRQ